MAELRFGGGINESSLTGIDFEECVDGANFRLDPYSRAFTPRPGIDLAGSAPTVSSVGGIMQLIKQDDTETTLVQCDTTVYQWASPTWTSVGTATTGSKLRGTTWALDDVLVITDLEKKTVVKTWDASTFTDLAHGISGVTDLYAKYAVVHNDRVWLFNIKTDSTDLPHLILASAFDDYDDYAPTSTSGGAGGSREGSRTGNESFWLVVPDLRPINGVALFESTIIISTENGRLFKLIGSDADDYAFEQFYPKSHAIGSEGMVAIGTDLMYLKSGGRFELLSAAERFGDLDADDVGRYLSTCTSGLCNVIMVYDQTHQQVFAFGSDECYVYNKTLAAIRPGVSPWSRYTSLNGLNAQAAMYLREPAGTKWTVYWGDASGNVYDMDGGSSDAGAVNIDVFRTSRYIDTLPTESEVIRGKVEYRRRGAVTLELGFDWAESMAQTQISVPLKNPVDIDDWAFWGGAYYWGGSIYWGASGNAEEQMSRTGFTPHGKGPGFFVTTRISSQIDFFINRLIV